MKGIKVEKVNYKNDRKIVYDIEVQDNHNFYANHFLVHNCAVFHAKKKYYARVLDSEGTRFPEDDPYIKVMGLEIARSSTPKWAKKYLKEAIPHILDKDEDDLRDWLREIKEEFVNADINDIASGSGVSNIDYNLGDKGVPIGARSVLVHNKYIQENGLDNKYSPIQAGDKTKRVFLLEPNKFDSNVVAYTNDLFVEEVKDCIDYDTQFEKSFLKPLEIMTSSLKYNLEKETQSLDDW